MGLSGQRGIIAQALLIIILILGLIVGVYLIKNPTIFKSKAANPPILDALKITDTSSPEPKELNCDGAVNPPACEISSPDVIFTIKDINALIPNNSGPTGSLFQFPKQVYAQSDTSCAQGNCNACETQTITVCGDQNAYAGDCDFATACKNNPTGKYTCRSRENPNGCSFDQYDCSACNSSITGKGYIDETVSIPVSKTCAEGNCSACATETLPVCGNQNVYSGDCNYATACKNNPQGKYTCRSSQNPNGCSFDQYDCSLCDSSVTDSEKSPSPTASPTLTVTSLILDINGSKATLGRNYSHKAQLPISDLTQESIIPIKIDAIYSDGSSNPFYINFHYKPKQITVPNANEFLVDLIISKDLTNTQETTNWAKDIINNYINNIFQTAGIRHRLKVDNIYIFDGITCPPGTRDITPLNQKCAPPIPHDKKIRVWLYRKGYQPEGMSTIASQSNATAYIVIDENRMVTESSWYPRYLKNSFAHEVAHLFTLPDYYFEDMSPQDNKVVPIGFKSYVKDLMWSAGDEYAYLSETSKGFVNKVASLPPGFEMSGMDMWNIGYTPRKVILKIMNDNDLPISKTRVDVFSAVHTSGVYGIEIPNKIVFSGITDQNGEFILLEKNNFLNPLWYTISFFLRITNDSKVRYTAITRSYLNTLYFQGQTETSTISLQFSSLTTYEQGKFKTLSIKDKPETAPTISEEERKLVEEHRKRHLEQLYKSAYSR